MRTIAAIELSSAHESLAVAVLTRAFMDDPIYSYVFPDETLRAKYTHILWKALIHTCRLFGRVYTTPTIDGVACWTAPGKTELSIGRAFRSGFAIPLAVMRFPAKARRRMFKALSVLDRERRRLMTGPFWYLQVLGVEPTRQGLGLGSSLIAPVLAIADIQGLPCYLETETEANVAFYEKRGFTVKTNLKFPGPGLQLWTMERSPSPTSQAAA